ncbi:MAG: SRPBCC family protein [Gordonia sp. (in: high G+C Gram-positive bacteria)]|uniref:SRPBCC family protein n=1 Tax=Gordonia sp. (in: high G+C Gram-positive bacteria) TaxID=84139 RepID=UPI0039E68728
MATELIEESIDIDASPQKVWSIVSDLRTMGERSPQCKKMFIFGGDVKQGTRTLNINRRGPLVWPTNCKVVAFTPNQEIAWKIVENGTVWAYKITPKGDGVTLTESRTAANGETSKISSFLVDRAFGGNDNFEVELHAGMRETLGKIKRSAES